MFSVREIIDIAIRLEKNAEDFYCKALEQVSDSSLKKVLRFLADQEGEHGKWFERLKEHEKISTRDVGLDESGFMPLQDLIGDQRFSLSEVNPLELDTTEKLIEVAIEHEKDTILFYEMIGAFVDEPETMAGLNVIIAEENRHIELLEGYGKSSLLSIH